MTEIRDGCEQQFLTGLAEYITSLLLCIWRVEQVIIFYEDINMDHITYRIVPSVLTTS